MLTLVPLMAVVKVFLTETMMMLASNFDKLLDLKTAVQMASMRVMVTKMVY